MPFSAQARVSKGKDGPDQFNHNRSGDSIEKQARLSET